MNLSGNTILITGGGSGIGLSIAQALAKHKNKIIITGRNEEKLKKACATNKNFHYIVCDVSNNEQIEAAVAKCGTEHGGINVLINNAGIFNLMNYNGGDPMPSIEHQLQEVDIDFNGPIRMVHYFLPQLRAQKKTSAIVNVSSGLAFVPLSSAPIYCATKAGIHSWTRSLRFQLAKTNVKVFELCPPLVDTPMVDDFKGPQFKDFKMMQPDALANAFVKGFQKDNYEIAAGQAKQLRFMGRWASNFIFKAINKAFNYQ